MGRIFNFSAGPAVLPESVLKIAQDQLLDYKGTGMSLMEMSHRSKPYDEVHMGTLATLRRLAGIPDDFDILFMTGGASLQFALVPMNLGRGNPVGYVNTGAWSEKAIKEAEIQGLNVVDAGSSASSNHNHIPAVTAAQGLDYLHLTSNNTIFGTQWQSFPDSGDTKLVVDMSSDFLSRPIDWKHMGLVYAGAQKNAGPAGLTLVILRKEYYEREKKSTPTMLRYSTHGKNDSLYNTPPTFLIYLFSLVLGWIEEQGGLTGIASSNQKKADLIYNALDAYPTFYLPHARKDSRSLMNITFNLANKDLEKEFLSGSEKLKMDGLKGHRSVGGFRASIYNAMPHSGCQCLADYLNDFAKKHG